jgi:hypothetical protein
MKRMLAVVIAAVAMVSLVPGVATASEPSTSRSHWEFPVRIDSCGIGTLNLSIEQFTQVHLWTASNGTVRWHWTDVDLGTGVDPATGITYRFVDRFSQTGSMPIPSDRPLIDTAERTLVISGGEGGLVARGLNHLTLLPDGTAVSDVSVHFVRCR